MNIKKLTTILFVVLLSSCKTTYYPQQEEELYSRLYNNYKSYADYKENNYDWKGARVFNKKAKNIKKGIKIMPENVPENMDLDDFFSKGTTYKELLDMRNRMYLIINNETARQNYPDETADLQFYYDCWILESKDYERYGQMARCRQGFEDNLTLLEYKLAILTTKEKDLIKNSIDKKEEIVSNFYRPKNFTIYFDFDSSALTEDSSRILWQFMDYIKTINGAYTIQITGHADRTGSKEYNEKISERRLETVKHYLIKNGINQDIIKTKYYGEIYPSVITSNGYKEETNRRVVITIKPDNTTDSQTDQSDEIM